VIEEYPTSYTGNEFDLIVIGAGINGVGIARDASLRGLRVLLLDKGDVASGTTSWSTRLIHGGLRYLEHGEIGLVRESLHERERLLKIAPHLMQSLPLMLPIYQGDTRGPLTIRAGMMAYDALSFGKSLPHHQMLDRDGALQRAPGLSSDRLRGAALYFDGQAEYPERLTLENALDARDHGADVRTYHEVDTIAVAAGRVVGIEGHDVFTGQRFRAGAPVIANVAGPWVDEVLAGVPKMAARRRIGGTKGSHIAVEPFPGAPRDGLYVEARRDRRPFFILPWNDLYLIGTTDTRFEGDLDCVIAEDWEIAWLLQETNRVIPAAGLARSDVLYSYAGVRPLPFVPGAKEGSVTRRHAIVDHGAEGGPRGLLSVVGGKLTTYRELAEQVVDLVQRRFGRVERSWTASIPLPGGRTRQSWPEFQAAFSRDAGLPEKSAMHLLRVYGTRAPSLLERATTPELRAIIDPARGAIAAEVPWAFEEEGARTLADLLARRSMVGLGPHAGVGADCAAASVARDLLGWDMARADAEIGAYRRWVSRYRPRRLEPANSGADS
jgi:glycerol-3-phosphate dehydrogenase